MGKFTVTLRRRPRLVVESFEDRRLLSSGPSLFSVSSEWLTSALLNRSLDSGSLSLLPSPTKTDAVAELEARTSQWEAQIIEQNSGSSGESTGNGDNLNLGDPTDSAWEKDVHTQDEVSNEGPSNAEGGSDLPGGENSPGSETGGNEVAIEPGSDSGGGSPIDGGPEGTPDNLENASTGENGGNDSGDSLPDHGGSVREALRERLEANGADVPASYPVVVQVLKNYIRDHAGAQDGSSTSGDQNVLSSDGDTPAAVRDGSNSSATYEAHPVAEVSHAPANAPATQARTETAGANRPGLVRSEESAAGAAHTGRVGEQAATPLSVRPDAVVAQARDADRVSQAQLMQRGQSDTAGTGRGPEVADGRHPVQAVATAAEIAVSVALQRAGLTPRQPAPSTAGAEGAADASAAETPAAGAAESAERLPVRLGIMDLAAFIPHFSGLMQGSMPFDQEAMQAAMQQFLEQMENLGGDAASWLAQMNLSPWVVAIAVGLTGCEVARRRQQQAQRGLVLTDDDGTPVTWFPGLAGLWTMRDA